MRKRLILLFVLFSFCGKAQKLDSLLLQFEETGVNYENLPVVKFKKNYIKSFVKFDCKNSPCIVIQKGRKYFAKSQFLTKNIEVTLFKSLSTPSSFLMIKDSENICLSFLNSENRQIHNIYVYDRNDLKKPKIIFYLQSIEVLKGKETLEFKLISGYLNNLTIFELTEFITNSNYQVIEKYQREKKSTDIDLR